MYIIIVITQLVVILEGDDFNIMPPLELTFRPTSDMSQVLCVNISIVSDGVVEGAESFQVNLAGVGLPELVTVQPSSAVVNITDENEATIGLQQTEYTASEGEVLQVCAGIVTLPSGGTDVPLTVMFSVLNGSDTFKGDDFNIMSPLELSFRPTSDTSQVLCVNISIVSDGVVEGAESFQVNLAGVDLPELVTVQPFSAVVNIIDENEARVGLQQTEYTASEGEVLQVCAVIVALPSGGTDVPLTVMFSVGNTLKGDDFDIMSPLELTFRPTSDMSQVLCVNISIVSDGVVEGAESFQVNLAGVGLPELVTVQPSSAVVNIIDRNEARVGLQQTEYNVSEGEVLQVCAGILDPPGSIDIPLTVMFSVVNGSDAFEGDDFNIMSPLKLTFLTTSDLSQVLCVNISIVSDGVVEGAESFQVNLAGVGLPELVTVQPSSAVVNVIDGEEATVGLQQAEYNVSEGEVLQVCAVIMVPSGGTDVPLALMFSVVNGTNTFEGDDFNVLTPLELMFLPTSDQTTVLCVNISIISDGVVEGAESFQLNLVGIDLSDIERVMLGSPELVIVQPSSAVVNIIDGDEATVGLQQTEYTASEGEVLQVCAVIVALPSGGTDVPLTVMFSVVNGSNTLDYNIMPPLELTFSPTSDMSQVLCVNISIVRDAVVEGAESFQVNLAGVGLPELVTVQPSSAVVNIIDENEARVGLQQTEYNVNEGEVLQVCAVIVALPSGGTDVPPTGGSTVPPTGGTDMPPTGSDIPLTVMFSVVNGSDAFEGDDFNIMSPLKLTFLPTSDTSQVLCVNISIVSDGVVEGAESFQVNLAGVGLPELVIVQPFSAVVNIIDGDVSTTTAIESTTVLISPTPSSVIVELTAPVTTSTITAVVITPTPTPSPSPVSPLIEGIDYIKFLDFPFNKSIPSFLDSVSNPIYIAVDFPIGSQSVTEAYVGDNGIISFGSPWFFWFPEVFPTMNFFTRNIAVIAPFWSDSDLRLVGNVYYETYQLGLGGESDAFLDVVSSFIRNQSNLEDSVTFRGRWMVVAEWNKVHPYPHGNSFNNDPELANFVSKENTYQAIAITDGANSYAVFVYNCQLMQWSGLESSGIPSAVIGYNYPSGVDGYRNHPFSGLPNAHLVACSNQANLSDWTTLVYRISLPPSTILLLRQQCRDMSELELMSGVRALSNFARPCPCTFRQAILDRRHRFFFSRVNVICSHRRFSGRNGLNLCCYSFMSINFGSLLVDESLEAGSFILSNPFFERDQYINSDITFKETCCGVADLCNLYYMTRPLDNCIRYVPPRRAWFWGDPHITFLDGMQYTFNGWGEYVLLETSTVENRTFVIQGRTEPAENTTATLFSAFAFGQIGLNDSITEIRAENNSLTVLVGGIDISANLSQPNDTFITESVSIEMDETGTIFTTFPDEVTVQVQLVAGIPNLVVSLPEELMNKTRGLLGNFNDDKLDDFIYPNGTLLSANSTDREIHSWGQEWEIHPEDSLFTYPADTTAQNFSNPDHIPVFLSDIMESASPEILEACGGNPECVFDYAATGNPEIGLGTLSANINNTQDQEEASNFPPRIQGPERFRVNIGNIAEYTFNVTDNDNFTVSLTSIITGNLTDFIKPPQGGTEYKFIWELLEVSNDTVEFVATDSFSATSQLAPTIEMCACENGGVCTLDGVTNLDQNPIVMNCNCPDAWTGRFCEEDRNGCSEVTCYPGVVCIDVAAPGVGAQCDSCPSGFTGNGIKCTDNNECALDTDDCEQECTNTPGSYECSCFGGYQISTSNQSACEDVDECTGVNECHQICINAIGSFMCNCSEGFFLNPDNRTCTVLAVFACSDMNNCSQECVKLSGVENCSCNAGYKLENDMTTCVDVNECNAVPSPCVQNCTNRNGSFSCDCNEGYSLNSDGINCDDINECLTAVLRGEQLCSSFLMCNNTIGSFECLCPPGTELTNNSCLVIVIPEPTRIVVTLVPSTLAPTQTMLPTPPAVAFENALLFTLPSFNVQSFNMTVQEQFRRTTADAVDVYCEQTAGVCDSIPLSRKRRQNAAIQPGDVILFDIKNNLQGQVTFGVYIRQDSGVIRVAAFSAAVMAAISSGRYIAQGFAGVRFIQLVQPSSSSFPTPTVPPSGGGLSNDELIGVIVGSSVGGILIIILLILLVYCWLRNQRRKTRGEPVSLLTYGIAYKEEFSRPSNTYVVSNPVAEVEEEGGGSEVQSIHLHMTEGYDSSSQSSSETSIHKVDESLNSQDLVTVF